MKRFRQIIQKLIIITMLLGTVGGLDFYRQPQPIYAANRKQRTRRIKKRRSHNAKKGKKNTKAKKSRKLKAKAPKRIRKNFKIDNNQSQSRKIPQSQHQLPTAKVYLAMSPSDPDYALALQGMQAWNQTGAFSFVQTNSLKQAQIAITNGIWPNVSWAGLTEMPNVPKGYLYGSIIRLNDYYIALLDHQIGLDVVEHELGHAIGLNHDDSQKSVMNSTIGPDHSSSIQPIDVAHVRALYQEK